MKKFNSCTIGSYTLCTNSSRPTDAKNQIAASEQQIVREVKVGSFDHILLNGSGNIIFTPTEGPQHLELTTPEHSEHMFQIYVKDRTLVIDITTLNLDEKPAGNLITLRVSAPMVESITLDGTGNFVCVSPVNSSKPLELISNGIGDFVFRNIRVASLKASLNGSGDINFGEITASQIRTSVNGVGNITIDALDASEVEGAINGLGKVLWKRVSSDETTLTISGSGSIEILELQTRKVRGILSGAGNLELAGNSESAQYLLSGSGSISASELKSKVVAAFINHGHGDIYCHASDSILMSRIGSSHSINVSGNPKHVERVEPEF